MAQGQIHTTLFVFLIFGLFPVRVLMKKVLLMSLGGGVLGLLGLLAFRPVFQTPLAPSTRPNLLLLLADDMTFSAIRALDETGERARSAGVITPTLDSLVGQGTTFTRAYIMGGLVPAICSPSRAMLLTGRPLYRLELPNGRQLGTYPLTGRDEIMPETFRKAGYTTFTTGKHHNGQTELGLGYMVAQSVFFGGMSDHYNTPGYDLNPAGQYPPDKAHRSTLHSSDEYAETTIRFIRQQANSEKPFFAYVPFRAPHDPRQAPAAYRAMYDPKKLRLPANVLIDHPFDNGELRVRDEELLPHPRQPERLREELADYYALITHLDAQIGRIMAALRETGQAENTVIVFAADNGLALGQHGLLGKQNLYEHSMRIPMIWSGPGIPKGQRRQALVYLHDIFPTLCELVQVRPPTSVLSSSLGKAIQNSRTVVHQQLYLSYAGVQRAIRTDRYKLIEYVVNGKRTTQLFDEQTDPLEMNNLADKPTYARQLASLRATLQTERNVQGDTTARFWQRF